MEDKSLELLTEEEREFFDEYSRCQNQEEIEELIERNNKLNESKENKGFTRLHMTLEEFRAKYHTVSYEEVMKKLEM